jgi:hypothetical protein
MLHHFLLLLLLPLLPLLTATASVSSQQIHQCSNSTTFCQQSEKCCQPKYSPTGWGCAVPGVPNPDHLSFPPSPVTSCCTPGPKLPPSTTLKNLLVIADSVSIGYTSTAANYVSDIALLQHGPYDISDGGAGSTAVGEICLNNFLVTQAQVPVQWDAILFNFGLHDMQTDAASKATYKRQLTNITTRLNATKAKLIYALTTPFMPAFTSGNTIVPELNQIAMDVMKLFSNIEILDLYTLVTNHCGTNYTTCDWCRVEPCSYHYNSLGETAQGLAVGKKFRQVLNEM